MALQAGFWDYEEQLARLTKGGDPLVKLAAVVDLDVSNGILNRRLHLRHVFAEICFLWLFQRMSD
jgi:hypothetical protein